MPLCNFKSSILIYDRIVFWKNDCRKHSERCLIHVFIIPNSVNLPSEMNTPKGEVEGHMKVILSVTQLTYSAHKKQVKPRNTFLFPQPFHLYDIS